MKIKIFVLIMVVMILFAGCGSGSENVNPSPSPTTSAAANPDNNETKPATEEKSKYYFEYNGTAIYMNDVAKPVLDVWEEPMHYFESPSCAFQGIDRVYTYNGFELYTYTDGDDETEYIFSVVFMNDSVETNEGITIGSKLEDVISKYGDDFTQEGKKYTYTDSNTTLSFVLENDEEVEVSYNLILN